jgi:hypothetical protein
LTCIMVVAVNVQRTREPESGRAFYTP